MISAIFCVLLIGCGLLSPLLIPLGLIWLAKAMDV